MYYSKKGDLEHIPSVYTFIDYNCCVRTKSGSIFKTDEIVYKKAMNI